MTKLHQVKDAMAQWLENQQHTQSQITVRELIGLTICDGLGIVWILDDSSKPGQWQTPSVSILLPPAFEKLIFDLMLRQV